MGSFGERMRRERDKRGVTLQSISQATKIGIHTLEALENEEFEKLPGGIFNKSFVRLYARFLGINEEQAVNEFIAVAGDPEQPLPDPPVPRRLQIPRYEERRAWGGIATVVVCGIALLFGGWKAAPMVRRAAGATWSRVHRTTSRPAMTQAEIATNNASQGSERSSGLPATDPPQNVATATLQPASQTTTTPAPVLVLEPAPTRTEEFVILVRANQPTWVSITADGEPFLQGILKRKRKIHAYSEVVLKTNNAGALTVSRNGKPLPPLGGPDQQTTVTFTPDGVTQ